MKRVLLTYDNIFAILLSFLKYRNYYILPLNSHVFFFFLAIYLYFAVLTVVFAYEGAQVLMWFSFVISVVICIFLLIIIRVFAFYYTLEKIKKKKTMNLIKKDSKILYFENGNEYYNEKDQLLKKKTITFDILVLCLTGLIAFLFIWSTFQVFFNVDNMFDPLIGLLICFLIDFFAFRPLLILSFLMAFMIYHKFNMEILKGIYLKDKNLKQKKQNFEDLLSKIKKDNQLLLNNESKIELKSTERLNLMEKTYLAKERNGFYPSNQEEHQQTFGNRNGNLNDNSKIIYLNESNQKLIKIYSDDINSSNNALHNMAPTYPISKINENNQKTGELEKIAKTPSQMKIEEIMKKESFQKTPSQIKLEDEANSKKKYEQYLLKISNQNLKENLNEILKNSDENYIVGMEEIVEDNLPALIKHNEMEEIIIYEGSFYKIADKENKSISKDLSNGKQKKNGKNADISVNKDKNHKDSKNNNNITKDLENSQKTLDTQELAMFAEGFLKRINDQNANSQTYGNDINSNKINRKNDDYNKKLNESDINSQKTSENDRDLNKNYNNITDHNQNLDVLNLNPLKNPNNMMQNELDDNSKFKDYYFVSNILPGKKFKKREKNKIYNEKDENQMKIKEKMIAPPQKDDFFLEKFLNKLKTGWHSEIFDKITNKTLAKNVKKILLGDINEIAKLKEKYEIGCEEYDEGRLKPLAKNNEYEEIILSNGIFYNNKLLKEETKENKNSEEKKTLKSSTLKNKKWLKDFIKFSEEYMDKIRNQQNIGKINKINENSAKINKKTANMESQNDVFEFQDFVFIPNLQNKYLKKRENKTKYQEKDKSLLKLKAKMKTKNKKMNTSNKLSDSLKNKNEENIKNHLDSQTYIKENNPELSDNQKNNKNLSESQNFQNDQNHQNELNENIEDISPTKPKNEINSTLVKHDKNMNLEEFNKTQRNLLSSHSNGQTSKTQSAKTIEKSNLFNSPQNNEIINFRKNKFKKSDKKGDLLNKNSKQNTPKSAITNLSAEKKTDNGQFFNNYFDQNNPQSKDPRHNRFKAKDKFHRKNNLSVNTRDISNINKSHSGENINYSNDISDSSAKNKQNLEIYDLDSLNNKLIIEESKKKALMGNLYFFLY